MESGQLKVNKVLLDQLFSTIVACAIEESKVNGVPDYELAFYTIERIAFHAGQESS